CARKSRPAADGLGFAEPKSDLVGIDPAALGRERAVVFADARPKVHFRQRHHLSFFSLIEASAALSRIDSSCTAPTKSGTSLERSSPCIVGPSFVPMTASGTVGLTSCAKNPSIL